MDEKVARVYGDKVRVRACGLLIRGDELLMVNHKGITDGDFWAPPGGGVEFGDSIGETLIREFREETGLLIKPLDFLFGCEYINKPIHSVELFYRVEKVGGKIEVGADPEIQIIDNVKYLTFRDIKGRPAKHVHGIFRFTDSMAQLEGIRGFYRI